MIAFCMSNSDKGNIIKVILPFNHSTLSGKQFIMFLEIVVGLLSIVIGYCVYLKKVKWTYFEKKGILQMPTSLPFGNFNEMIFQVWS